MPPTRHPAEDVCKSPSACDEVSCEGCVCRSRSACDEASCGGCGCCCRPVSPAADTPPIDPKHTSRHSHLRTQLRHRLHATPPDTVIYVHNSATAFMQHPQTRSSTYTTPPPPSCNTSRQLSTQTTPPAPSCNTSRHGHLRTQLRHRLHATPADTVKSSTYTTPPPPSCNTSRHGHLCTQLRHCLHGTPADTAIYVHNSVTAFMAHQR